MYSPAASRDKSQEIYNLNSSVLCEIRYFGMDDFLDL